MMTRNTYSRKLSKAAHGATPHETNSKVLYHLCDFLVTSSGSGEGERRVMLTHYTILMEEKRERNSSELTG